MNPIEHSNALPAAEDATALCAQLTADQRARKLRFGDRVLCPFLRPFFLSAADEARVKAVVETLWTLGERVAQASLERPDIMRQLAMTDDEIRLARIDPGY